LGGGEEGEREEREKGIRGVVLGWGSHVNSFAKLAQVTDAQNKACVKRSRVLFRGTPKIVYTQSYVIQQMVTATLKISVSIIKSN
jgi:hypothetical protein